MWCFWVTLSPLRHTKINWPVQIRFVFISMKYFIDRSAIFQIFFFHFFLSPLTILFAIHAYTVHTRTHIYYDRANRSVISFELCYTLKMIIITFTFAILNENVSFYLCVHVYACMLAMTMSPISNIITCMHEHAYILARRIFECQIRN